MENEYFLVSLFMIEDTVRDEIAKNSKIKNILAKALKALLRGSVSKGMVKRHRK